MPHFVKKFDINGVKTKQVACIELHGRPNAATKGAVGVLGMDVDSPTHEIYKCVGVMGGIYVWEVFSSGSGGSVGITPVFEIDEVVTLEAGERAYVDIDNADPANPRISFGLPRGADGADGKSAYEIYLANGGTLSETEWLASLHGKDGVNGQDGVDGQNGADGLSAYEVWLSEGNEGTVDDYLASLKGKDGADGKDGTAGADGRDGQNGVDGRSAYDIWLAEGNTGTEADFLASLKGENGKDGVDGKDGYTPQKGVDYFDGVNGKDGADGKDGKDGTSVIVSSVTESTESGGENVVEFSDGKKLTIINGSDGRDGIDGDDGRTPVKGVDYFTPVEIDNIRNEIGAELSQIPTPPIVSSVTEMTDTTKHYVLQSSGHIYAARTIQTGGEVIRTPNFTNLFDKSAVTLNAYIGGTDNAAEDGSFVTDLMPFDIKTLAVPQMIRIANWYNDIGYHKRNKIAWYPSGSFNINCVDQLNSTAYVLVDSSDLDLQTITCQAGKIPNTNTATTSKITGFKLSFRAGASAITLNDIPDDMIITVNEEITYTETTTPVETITEWYDTGISYSPTYKTDLVGVMGENNVIYLSDNLPSGTYTLVYPDNNYATVGTITK